jgi:hypothetical protein
VSGFEHRRERRCRDLRDEATNLRIVTKLLFDVKNPKEAAPGNGRSANSGQTGSGDRSASGAIHPPARSKPGPGWPTGRPGGGTTTHRKVTPQGEGGAEEDAKPRRGDKPKKGTIGRAITARWSVGDPRGSLASCNTDSAGSDSSVEKDPGAGRKAWPAAMRSDDFGRRGGRSGRKECTKRHPTDAEDPARNGQRAQSARERRRHHRNEQTCDVSGPAAARAAATGPRAVTGDGDRGTSRTSTSCERASRSEGARTHRSHERGNAAHIRRSSERTALVFGPGSERGRCRRPETRRCTLGLDERASERRARWGHGRRAISDDRSRTRKKHREPTRTERTERRPRTAGTLLARAVTGGARAE